MARGYWQPPNCENLIACDGYFVDANAIPEMDEEKSWDSFLELVSKALLQKENTLKFKKEWKSVDREQSRFVLVCDNCVDVVAEETKGYYAIYVLVPEDCMVPNLAKQSFWKYKLSLKQTLIELFPGCVKARKNYRQLIDIG